ncbi:MAG: universal stress protein [Caulobacter sp.]|nr:universal stress protein [Caulobacter sp.]
MSFKTLLVHVEANTSPDVRLSLAVNLANQLHAKLIGVGAEFFRSPYYGGDGVDYFAGDLIAAEMASIEADLKRAEVKFRAAAAAVREGHEWRGSVQFPVAAVAAEARAADLVITSHSGAKGASDYNIALPAVLILQAGRPVLVAPPDTAQLTVARVVVAWKDTREARRAVSDALPFLQGAEEVHLVELCDGPEAIPAATGRLTHVADYLLRHGVSATIGAEIESQDANAPHQLLDVAERHNADLIVAGAYGHSRLREWVFGGFTRALLSQTKRAVLFGH